MTDTRNVCSHFHAIHETDTRDLTQCRIRLFWGCRVYTSAYTALLGISLKRRGLLLVDRLLAALADQLVNSRQGLLLRLPIDLFFTCALS